MEQTRARLQAADVVVDLVGVTPGQVQGLNHVDKGGSFPIDKLLDEISPDDHGAVVLPGGAVNADGLRVSKAAQDFVTAMDEAKNPVVAICHAAWLPVSAGLLKGRTLTSLTIKDSNAVSIGWTVYVAKLCYIILSTQKSVAPKI